MRRFTPDRHPELTYDAQGRVLVEVVKAEGTEVAPGIIAADPEIAKPKIGLRGWCDEDALLPDEFAMYPGHTNPRIELDDGSIIWGYECWWKPVKKGEDDA